MKRNVKKNNIKRTLVFILIAGSLVFLAGCPDPDESGIPNCKDFKESKLNVDPGRNVIITDIYFYDDICLDEFFYYFDHDNSCDADFLVKCRPGEFTVLKESESSPGLFDIVKYNGTPTVSGVHYHLEFPIESLELGREFTTYYWFFAMDGGDRMPDSEKKQIAYVR